VLIEFPAVCPDDEIFACSAISLAELQFSLGAIVSQKRPNHARSKDIMLAGHAYSLCAAMMTRNPKDFELVSTMVTVLSA
jgi:hypothetical protein